MTSEQREKVRQALQTLIKIHDDNPAMPSNFDTCECTLARGIRDVRAYLWGELTEQ